MLDNKQTGGDTPSDAGQARRQRLNLAFRISSLLMPVVCGYLIYIGIGKKYAAMVIVLFEMIFAPLFLILALQGLRFGPLAKQVRRRGLIAALSGGGIVLACWLAILAMSWVFPNRLKPGMIATVVQGVAGVLFYTAGVFGFGGVIVGTLQAITGVDIASKVSLLNR